MVWTTSVGARWAVCDSLSIGAVLPGYTRMAAATLETVGLVHWGKITGILLWFVRSRWIDHLMKKILMDEKVNQWMKKWVNGWKGESMDEEWIKKWRKELNED